MTNLALVSNHKRGPSLLPTQWAHDVRNLLATVGLHLDTLGRLSGPHGAKAVGAAHALVAKLSGMCGEVDEDRSRRHPFDIAATVRHVIDVLAPVCPEKFAVNFVPTGSHFVFANANEVFRILFNLIHNAVAVGLAEGSLSRVDISIAHAGQMREVKISDNGRGLPPQVVARLYREPTPGGAVHGHGLAIARELTDRNGGTLTCETSRKGTTFRLALAAFTSVHLAEGPVTRSLGKRVGG